MVRSWSQIRLPDIFYLLHTDSLIDCNHHAFFVGKTLAISNVNYSGPRPEHDIFLYAIISPSTHHHPRPEHDVPFHVQSLTQSTTIMREVGLQCVHIHFFALVLNSNTLRVFFKRPTQYNQVSPGWMAVDISECCRSCDLFIIDFWPKYLLLQSGLFASTASGLYSFFKDEGNFNTRTNPDGPRTFVLTLCYSSLLFNIGAVITSFILIDNLLRVGEKGLASSWNFDLLI